LIAIYCNILHHNYTATYYDCACGAAPEIQRVEKGGGGAVAVPLRSVLDYSDNYTTLETRGLDNGSWALERAQVSETRSAMPCDAL